MVGATSPGRIVCKPANNVVAMKVVPGSAGFSSTSTRRSASRAVINSVPRIRNGLTSAQRQIAGTAAVPGSRRITRSQSGFSPGRQARARTRPIDVRYGR